MTIKWDTDLWKSSEKPSTTHCKHGHKMTVKNTGMIKHTNNGKLYPFCKACKAKRYREKYASDDEFRARSLTRATANYHRRKASHGLGQVP